MPAVDAKAINIYMSVTGPYANQMTRNAAVTRTFGNTANTSMGKARAAMAGFGAVASKVATVGAIGVAVALALSAKAAVTFESSFAGVRKTTETTEIGFRRLAEGIRKLATEIPIGVNELNTIAELGGQLGVGADSLLEFTETIALIGVTTTLSTDEAAIGFARLDNIMQLNQGSFEQIGSSIVGLGNNFAALENEILDFALRIAPAGAVVGATTDELLAIATAFTSVGITSERGGTAVQKTLIKIANAASEGGAELESFATTAGMTSESFAVLAKTDPTAAFAAFVNGLSRISDEGGSVFRILDSVGLANERVRGTLLAGAEAMGLLNETLALSKKEWEDNTALVEEADKRFETITSQLIIAKNKIIDLGIAIGVALLPILSDFVLGISTVIDFVKEQNRVVLLGTAAILGLTVAAKLATASPLIKGLTLVAGAFFIIGRNAADAAERVKALESVLTTGTTTKEGLITLLGEENLKGLFNAGFKQPDIRKAIFGTEADYQTFLAQAQQEALLINSDLRDAVSTEKAFGDESGFLFAAAGQLNDPISKAVQEIKKRREELGRIRGEEARIEGERARARILGVKTRSSREQEAIAEAGRATVRAMIRARQGIVAEADKATLNFGDVFIKPEFVEDVADSLADYVDTVDEAFTEVQESIFGNLDAWFEFDDELEVAWDDIIATLTKQVQVMADINELIAEAALAPDVETLFRSVVSDPGVGALFLELTPEEQAAFVENIRGVAIKAREAVFEEWRRKQEAIKFVAGEQFLSDIAAVALEIEADPDNDYNPAEIWFGLILNTLETEGPEVRRKILETLIGAFGKNGQISSEIDATQAEINVLLSTLRELVGVYDIKIRTIIENNPGSDIFDFTPNVPSTFTDKPRKHGGFVFPDKSYLVGELGPERFQPFNAGTIIPNDKLGGKEVVYNLNVYGSEDTGSDARTLLLTAQTIGAF